MPASNPPPVVLLGQTGSPAGPGLTHPDFLLTGAPTRNHLLTCLGPNPLLPLQNFGWLRLSHTCNFILSVCPVRREAASASSSSICCTAQRSFVIAWSLCAHIKGQAGVLSATHGPPSPETAAEKIQLAWQGLQLSGAPALSGWPRRLCCQAALTKGPFGTHSPPCQVKAPAWLSLTRP